MAYVILGIVLGVLLLLALTSLVVVRRRRQRRLAAPPAAEPPATTATLPPPEAPTASAAPGPPQTVAPPPMPAPVEAPPVEAPPAEAAPAVEAPPPSAGRLVRLRGRLAGSQSTLGRGLLTLLSRDTIDDAVWDEVEDTLLMADVGVAATQEITERLREQVRVLGSRTPQQVRALLRDELIGATSSQADRTLATAPHDGRPAVVLVVGVNGTGKTTTCGKLARVLVGDGRTVLLGAADTFRAAAADQLTTWAERVGATVVRGPEGADPASVAFDAVKDGTDQGVDTVVIDTAGRLHTKQGLMDELGKVKRVVERQGAVDEVLLVLDATTGQNGLVQARVFAEVVDITGVVLTKLDGTAKGGIVIAVQRELGVPVKLVGLGEGADDLAPFEPEVFVDALLGEDLAAA
ncbi:MAG TPA: signal recognition particle-docking protein FtsY [Mycobacteriales bacterium]|nr:signal recognition particle-docking protein FtsY [Mycobacteriales bacterium]